MGRKLKAGEAFPGKALENIHGAAVPLPDPKARFVHLGSVDEVLAKTRA